MCARASWSMSISSSAMPEAPTVPVATATFSGLGITIAIDDFTYIAGVNRFSEAYLSKNTNWNSFEEMVDFGKERGYLSYASLIPLDRLVMQALAKKAGFELDILPTRGGSEARAALLAGDADFTPCEGGYAPARL